MLLCAFVWLNESNVGGSFPILSTTTVRFVQKLLPAGDPDAEPSYESGCGIGLMTGTKELVCVFDGVPYAAA